MKTITNSQLRPAFPVMVDHEDEIRSLVGDDDDLDMPDFIVQDPESVPMGGRYDEYLMDELGTFGFPSCFAERL